METCVIIAIAEKLGADTTVGTAASPQQLKHADCHCLSLCGPSLSWMLEYSVIHAFGDES